MQRVSGRWSPKRGSLPRDAGDLVGLRVSRLGSVTARPSSSGRQPNCGVEQRAPPIFGRATITLGIGPYSSYGRPM